MTGARPRYRQAPSASHRSEEDDKETKDFLDLFDTIVDRIGCFPLLLLGVGAFVGFKFYPKLLMSFGKWFILASVAVIGVSVLLYPILLLISIAQKSLGRPSIEVSMITAMRLVVAIPVTVAIGAFSLLLFFPLETLLFLIAFPFVAIFAKRESARKFQAGYPMTLRWLPELVEDVRDWVMVN